MQILGKYMIIGCLDPYSRVRNHTARIKKCAGTPRRDNNEQDMKGLSAQMLEL